MQQTMLRLQHEERGNHQPKPRQNHGWHLGVLSPCIGRVPSPRRHLGGIQIVCPFHALNDKSGCKKFLSLSGPQEADEENVLNRLRHWANQAQRFDRQRKHVRMSIREADTPAPAVVLQQKLEHGPSEAIRNDVQLDAEASASSAAPKAAAAGRPKARAARAKAAGSAKNKAQAKAKSAGAHVPSPADEAASDPESSSDSDRTASRSASSSSSAEQAPAVYANVCSSSWPLLWVCRTQSAVLWHQVDVLRPVLCPGRQMIAVRGHVAAASLSWRHACLLTVGRRFVGSRLGAGCLRS